MTTPATKRCSVPPGEEFGKQLNHENKTYVQENYNTPLQHTPGNPPSQLWKESLYSRLVKVARGVYQFGVVKQTLDYTTRKVDVYIGVS